jgi:hypothetical protein
VRSTGRSSGKPVAPLTRGFLLQPVNSFPPCDPYGKCSMCGTSRCGVHPTQRSFAWAQTHGYVIITFDEDFADARMYPAW